VSEDLDAQVGRLVGQLGRDHLGHGRLPLARQAPRLQPGRLGHDQVRLLLAEQLLLLAEPEIHATAPRDETD